MDSRSLKSYSEVFTRWVSRIRLQHVVVVLFLLSLGISLHCYLIPGRYNNYLIFKYSFEHLLNHQDLYLSYYNLDFYKYSPSFAFFMAVFYWMPDWMGVIVFNFFGLTVFLLGSFRLGFGKDTMKYILFFLFIEIGISLSTLQTNLLIAGCIMLAFSYLEEKRPVIASFLIVCTIFIKLFGLVAFALFLLYPKKSRFIFATALWFVAIGLLPLVVVSFEDLGWQYTNWWHLLQADHSASVGTSFIGWINSWFGLTLNKLIVVILAALAFCLPLLRISQFKVHFFRTQILASILLWVVIFNHKGESPTYVIAMMGVAIWYFAQVRSPWKLVLLWGCLIFTSMSSTDAITPLWITSTYVDPYSLKAVFCSLVWFKLTFDLVTNRTHPLPP